MVSLVRCIIGYTTIGIFLPINLNMCFEYPQHMFWLGNKKKNIDSIPTLLSGALHDFVIGRATVRTVTSLQKNKIFSSGQYLLCTDH